MVFYVLPICFFIPGKQYGSYENSINAFVMIWNNVCSLAIQHSTFRAIINTSLSLSLSLSLTLSHSLSLSLSLTLS